MKMVGLVIYLDLNLFLSTHFLVFSIKILYMFCYIFNPENISIFGGSYVFKVFYGIFFLK